MRLLLCACLVLLCFWATPAALAAPNKPYDREYSSGAGRKLERGSSNALIGWMEIPRQVDIQGKNHGPAAAALLGPVHGLGAAVARTAGGLFELATFPFPLTNRFQKVTEPEFVLDKNTAPR